MDTTAATFVSGYKYSYTQLLIISPIEVSGLIALLFASLLALISRSVYGRELLYNPPGTQMNVQSVPDFIRSAKIRTLLRGDVSVYFALRHGIYSHPDASAVIADWISADAHWADSQPFGITPDVTPVGDHGSPQACSDPFLRRFLFGRASRLALPNLHFGMRFWGRRKHPLDHCVAALRGLFIAVLIFIRCGGARHGRSRRAAAGHATDYY
jgi:hypothetical protein